MKLRPASPRNEILATLGRFRPALRSVALFTAVINLLMLRRRCTCCRSTTGCSAPATT